MSRLAVLALILGVGAVGACGGGDAIVPPPPSKPAVTIVAGNAQSANVRHSLPVPLAVAVRTPDGAALTNMTVAWTVTSGGGTLSASSVRTDGQGNASVVWTLGNAAGAQTVAAAVADANGSPASFSATAAAPIILHYDGTNWATALEDVSGAGISLASIWGSGNSAAFAVGKSCDGNLVLPYDGSHWGALPASCPGGGLSLYTSVWGSSASDVFVAYRSNTPPRAGGQVLHYDGQNWNIAYNPPCGGNGILCPSPQAVWSSSPADAFAVGDGGMIAHYDGSSWSALSSGTTQALSAVWGAGLSGAVFAVGTGGTILYYDRTAWHVQASGTTQPLYAVWGTSANDVFAVGAGGTVLHYDGASWTSQVSGSTQPLYAVWGSGASVLAVGDASTIVRYNGANWTAMTTSADMNLRGIWGTSPTNVFAVGAPR
jgi:hypothetical protein